MNAARAILTLSALLLPATPVFAELVNYEMVTVGNPGNANDTVGQGYGGVAYEYQIGKYPVTIGQYTAFLNAVDPDGTNLNGIYNTLMATDPTTAGILYTARLSPGSKYGVLAVSGSSPFGGVTSANRPITHLSWHSAARFANWMSNGQGSGSTETGAYTLNNASLHAVAANPGAAFYIPTENEWYKAAYYSPNNGGVGVPGYYRYATQSDTSPGNIIGSATNQANYFTGAGYSVTQSSSRSSSQNYLTDVGAFSGSQSYYGTFDQTGNVFQWNDLDGTASSSHNRGFRGGPWANSDHSLSSSDRSMTTPSLEDKLIGIRLASPAVVPEPSTYAMALAGLTCGGYSMFRRHKRA